MLHEIGKQPLAIEIESQPRCVGDGNAAVGRDGNAAGERQQRIVRLVVLEDRPGERRRTFARRQRRDQLQRGVEIDASAPDMRTERQMIR